MGGGDGVAFFFFLHFSREWRQARGEHGEWNTLKMCSAKKIK